MYKDGDIVLLADGREVYIFDVDRINKCYLAEETGEGKSETIQVEEDDIMEKLN